MLTTGSKNTILGAYSGNQGGLDIRTASNHIVLSDGDGNPRGRFNSSGDFFVGAVATVSSTVSGTQIFASGGINISAGTATTLTYLMGFINGNGTVGGITVNGSTTAYGTSSDYRLKNTIAPMTGALAKVALLKPCTYKWNADGSDGQGFIAHELQEIVPGCVTGEKDAIEMQQYEISPAVPATLDEEGNELTAAVEAVMGEREVPKYQGIDTSFLVATLTAAIKEQQAIITALTTRITALEAK